MTEGMEKEIETIRKGLGTLFDIAYNSESNNKKKLTNAVKAGIHNASPCILVTRFPERAEDILSDDRIKGTQDVERVSVLPRETEVKVTDPTLPTLFDITGISAILGRAKEALEYYKIEIDHLRSEKEELEEENKKLREKISNLKDG